MGLVKLKTTKYSVRCWGERESLLRGRGSFDIYDVIGNYKGDVLILHGDRDGIVPLRYSERAVDVYENAELVVMEGQNHGFVGKARTGAMERETAFFREHRK